MERKKALAFKFYIALLMCFAAQFTTPSIFNKSFIWSFLFCWQFLDILWTECINLCFPAYSTRQAFRNNSWEACGETATGSWGTTQGEEEKHSERHPQVSQFSLTVDFYENYSSTCKKLWYLKGLKYSTDKSVLLLHKGRGELVSVFYDIVSNTEWTMSLRALVDLCDTLCCTCT